MLAAGRRRSHTFPPRKRSALSVVRVLILGESAVEVRGRRLESDSPQLFTLAMYLATADGQFVHKSELVDLLFPDVSERNRAAHRLRQLLYRLRRMGAPILVDGQRVCIPRAEVETDFDAVLCCGAEERAALLSRRAAVLPHYNCAGSAASTWLESYRTRMQSLLRQRLTEDLHWFRQRADWRVVDTVSRRVLELDPLNETATLCLAEAIARTGSKASALAILETYEREIGVATPHLALPSQLLRKRIGRLSQRSAVPQAEQVELLGRSQEMEQLSNQWDRCRTGSFRATVVRGDKSIGKSRILQELQAVVELDGSGVVTLARVSERDRERPLALFADLARRLLLLPGAAGCDPDYIPLLRRLTDVSVPVGPIGATAPHSAYDEARLRNALSDLISSVAEERPLLCIVDDAQDLDAWSLDMLRAVMRRASSSRVLFVLGQRTHMGGNGQTAADDFLMITLPPLTHAVSKELLSKLCNRLGVALSDDDAEWSLEMAAGYPGHLELFAGSYLPSKPGRAVPADIAALTDERVASLSSEAKHALEAIALGQDGLASAGVARLTGLADYALLSALDELDRASLLRQSETGIQCRSKFIAERALASASPIAATIMHGRAAELLEAEHVLPTMTAAIAWRIAAHWKAAGQPKRARERLRACWQQAVDIGRPMVACDGIQRELEQSTSSTERATLLDDLIGALQAAGEIAQAHVFIEQRQALSDQVNDSNARREALAFDLAETEMFRFYLCKKRINTLLSHAESTELDSCRRLRSARLAMIAADSLLDQILASKVFSLSGRFAVQDLASDLLQRHIGLIYHTVFGERDAALALASEIDQMISTRERSWSRFASHRMCSLARQLVGWDAADYDELERDYMECLDSSMTVNAHQYAAHIASLLIDDGDIARAQDWMKKAESLSGFVAAGGGLVTYFSGQVDLALLAGDEVQARHFISQMQNHPQLYETGRLRNDLLLYRLRVDQVCCSASVTSADLNELFRFHEKGRRFGRHDDHMDVLWVALQSLGRSNEASRLLSDYLLIHRRERRPCRFFLRNRTKSDLAWRAITPSRDAVEQKAVLVQ
jgi:DNA-binding SARP family transcriptional activator